MHKKVLQYLCFRAKLVKYSIAILYLPALHKYYFLGIYSNLHSSNAANQKNQVNQQNGQNGNNNNINFGNSQTNLNNINEIIVG